MEAAIRGHHVYKVTWTPILDEVLICKKDNREEAKEYDLHAVGVYKESPDEGTGAPNENIVQNHFNIALLNEFGI